MTHLSTDVLVIGAGGAGMYAAIAAAREGARVLLIDKSLIGRGGATVMAQMTVAVALGHESEDDWPLHLADTLTAGRGLCDEPLAEALCRDAPARILEMDSWRVGWATHSDSGGNRRLRQITAPGHTQPRCVWVDFLNTGPAVSKTLRNQVHRMADRIRRVADLTITDLVVEDGRC
ncbi:MAG: FAD-binding protein, partial [Alphaproteobacteria bacterium]|nr:FAD-binding protein [Alphaproteobacteria bacterium]